MSVYRVHRHERAFVQIENTTIRDRRLSFRARGVLAYLLSQPPEFSATSEEIACQSPGEGRDAIRTGLRELEGLGYLRRERVQDQLGRWSTVIGVYELPTTGFQASVVSASVLPFPQVAPTTGKPNVGEPGDKDLRRSTSKMKDDDGLIAKTERHLLDAFEARSREAFGG